MKERCLPADCGSPSRVALLFGDDKKLQDPDPHYQHIYLTAGTPLSPALQLTSMMYWSQGLIYLKYSLICNSVPYWSPIFHC